MPVSLEVCGAPAEMQPFTTFLGSSAGLELHGQGVRGGPGTSCSSVQMPSQEGCGWKSLPGPLATRSHAQQKCTRTRSHTLAQHMDTPHMNIHTQTHLQRTQAHSHPDTQHTFTPTQAQHPWVHTPHPIPWEASACWSESSSESWGRDSHCPKQNIQHRGRPLVLRSKHSCPLACRGDCLSVVLLG